MWYVNATTINVYNITCTGFILTMWYVNLETVTNAI